MRMENILESDRLEIQAGLSQPSPDFSAENCKRITFLPEEHVIQ